MRREKDLRLTVLGDEDLVFAGGSVPRLDHCVTADCRQVVAFHVPQSDAAQLANRPVTERLSGHR